MDEFEAKLQEIDTDVKNNTIMLYMKGNKLMPQCGYSSRVVEILMQMGANFETKDVLQDDTLRSAIKAYSDWPTIPQLYIGGTFVGGCDVITQLYQSGELERILQ